MIHDARNLWTSSSLDISDITINDGHADVILQGDYFGTGDIVLIAARMQILLTVFADPSVQSASVKLNEKNVATWESVTARKPDPMTIPILATKLRTSWQITSLGYHNPICNRAFSAV